VSSFVTFLLFVRPFLLRLQGVSGDVSPKAIAMRADFDWPKPDRRNEFLRARINEAGRPGTVPEPGLGRADLDRVGRRPDRLPAGPGDRARRHGALHSVRVLTTLNMNINLRFFASVREALGTAGEAVTLPEGVATVGAVRDS
jgi:hypothetical protein